MLQRQPTATSIARNTFFFSRGKCYLGRYGAEKSGYLITARGEVGDGLPQGGHGDVPIREDHAVGGRNAGQASSHLRSASAVSAFSKQNLGKGQAGASPSQLAASFEHGFRVCGNTCVAPCPSVGMRKAGCHPPGRGWGLLSFSPSPPCPFPTKLQPSWRLSCGFSCRLLAGELFIMFYYVLCRNL